MSSSRTISWQAQVQDADPDWMKKKFRPTWYYFSNGRTFDWNGPNIYVQTST